MIRTDSSWSRLPQAPNIIVPRAYSLTEMPVPPRILRFMGVPPYVRHVVSVGCGPSFRPAGPGTRPGSTWVWQNHLDGRASGGLSRIRG
ncbi:hypothetical protein GCM10010246_75250 [Streptomyces cuspidosporus]|uniref:Uncharacterized protein n=1 Tax=Streptomyces cuspidosporus TaxID=66882 RepID=A0ABN3H633_9ACTN